MSDAISMGQNPQSMRNFPQSFPYTLPVEQYDKYGLWVPSESKQHVILNNKLYELLKNITLQHINLINKEEVTELNFEFVESLDQQVSYIKQFPEFVVTEQGKFVERAEYVKNLRFFTAEKHQKIIDSYKDTLTRVRKSLQDFAEKQKQEPIDLSKLNLNKKYLVEEETKREVIVVSRENKPLVDLGELPEYKGLTRSYEGEWVGDKRDGFGIVRYSNRSSYEGNFRDDQYNGFGKFFWPSGEYYEGDWVKGVMTGRGVYSWPSGERYEGSYLDGKEQGLGICSYPDGQMYYGEWSEGRRHGKGVLLDGKGGFYVGNFEKGQAEGKGTRFYSDGRVYKGQLKEGNEFGEGVIFYPGKKEKIFREKGKRKRFYRLSI